MHTYSLQQVVPHVGKHAFIEAANRLFATSENTALTHFTGLFHRDLHFSPLRILTD